MLKANSYGYGSGKPVREHPDNLHATPVCMYLQPGYRIGSHPFHPIGQQYS